MRRHERRNRRSTPHTSMCCRSCRRISGSSTAQQYIKLVEKLPQLWSYLYAKSDRPSRDSLVGKLKRAAEKLNTRKLDARDRAARSPTSFSARISCRPSCCRGTGRQGGATTPAVVGAGHRLRRARALGASARRSILRRERRSRVPARRSRRAARKDLGHRHSGDAAVQRAARSRHLRARARHRARQVHGAHDGGRRGRRRPRRARGTIAASCRRPRSSSRWPAATPIC